MSNGVQEHSPGGTSNPVAPNDPPPVVTYQVRLCWDNLTTEWADIPPGYFEQLVSGEALHTDLRIPPPTDWQFNLKMLNDLKGSVAVESTLVRVQFQAKP